MREGADWWVHSATGEEGLLLLRCRSSGEFATVSDASRDEWQRAFSAPYVPYRWEGDLGRIEPLS